MLRNSLDRRIVVPDAPRPVFPRKPAPRLSWKRRVDDGRGKEYAERVVVSGGKIAMDSKIGFPSVEFELTDARGELHSSKRYIGSWLLLVFHRHLG